MRVTFTARRLAEADAAYAAFVGGGFPVALGQGETLQCGSEAEQAKWLIFKSACDDAIRAGALPADPAPIPIRCTSNTNYAVTYGQALQIIADMTVWGFAAQANVWRLKDAISAAASNDELRAIDLTEGWP